MLSWLQSYISGRKQLIKVNGVVSNLTQVTSRIPQGGHLNTLLFNLFVNFSGVNISNVDILPYANDIEIFHKIESITDCQISQDQLNIFCQRTK